MFGCQPIEVRSHRSAGQRAGLSRQTVLGAARRIADVEGVDHLTMRRLASELGVMPNTLYSYFPDKEALLDALIDDLLGDIDVGDPADGDWRDGLVRVMDSSRRLLLTHPQLVPTFLARPGLGPNAARLGEITFTLLRRGGIDGERAVGAFRILLESTPWGFAAFQGPRLQIDSPERYAADPVDLRQPARGHLPRDASAGRPPGRPHHRPALPHRPALAARRHQLRASGRRLRPARASRTRTFRSARTER